MNSHPPFTWVPLYFLAASLFCCASLGAQTLTPTSTSTPAPTLTPTFTATRNVPIVSVPTPMGTRTPDASTATLTLTPTPAFTATPTQTPTSTATATSTPGILNFSISPKVDEQGKIKFAWGNTLPADEAFLKIYTSGFRIVREFEFDPTENAGYLTAENHEFFWDGKDENARPMPSGTYLCFVEVSMGKKKYEASGKTEIP